MLLNKMKYYLKIQIISSASTSAAVQCRGSCLPPAQLRGGWPEDDTECPPPSTAGVWLALHPDSDRESGMMAVRTSQDACKCNITK